MHPNLERYLVDIRKAGECGAWYAAVALALAVPDICSKAEGGGRIYRDWFDQYVKPAFDIPLPEDVPRFTGHDAYALRCAFLHAGNDDLSMYRHADEAVMSHIVLTESGSVTSAGVRKVQIATPGEKARLALPIGDLCEQIIRAAERWSLENERNRIVQSRLDRLLVIRPRSTNPSDFNPRN